MRADVQMVVQRYAGVTLGASGGSAWNQDIVVDDSHFGRGAG